MSLVTFSISCCSDSILKKLFYGEIICVARNWRASMERQQLKRSLSHGIYLHVKSVVCKGLRYYKKL